MSEPRSVQSRATAHRRTGAVRRALESAVMSRIARRLERTCVGCVQVTLPSGRSAVFGREASGRPARLVLNNYGVVWKTLLRGPLGFAESYMAGDVDSDSVLDVFNFFMDNERPLSTGAREFVASGWLDRAYHRLRANTYAGSKRNIAAHYDLGNAFYKLWLDDTLTYSSGVYPTPSTSLEAAQKEKYDRVLAALDLMSGDSVLEIGCGWGGLARVAAGHGARVTGITISQQQFDEARTRIGAAGLANAVELRMQDYRETSGTFDRVVSIEMIEAVGEENWPLYFQTVADRLRPGGQAVIQAITIRQDLYQNYRQNPDFIQRYVFPGGMLPTVAAMREHAAIAGLDFEVVETFGSSYALTLAHWRRNFHAAWPEIERLGFDDRFRRLWDYYLTYCQVGFERGSVDVGLYRLVETRRSSQRSAHAQTIAD